jgi:hypothetical protein
MIPPGAVVRALCDQRPALAAGPFRQISIWHCRQVFFVRICVVACRFKYVHEGCRRMTWRLLRFEFYTLCCGVLPIAAAS